MDIKLELSFRKHTWIPFILPFVYFSYSKNSFWLTISFLWLTFNIHFGYCGCSSHYFVLLPCASIRFGCCLDYWVEIDFSFWKYHDCFRFFMKKSWIEESKNHIKQES